MEYKDYVGSVHYSDEDEVFHGRLEGIRDLVTYEGTEACGYAFQGNVQCPRRERVA